MLHITILARLHYQLLSKEMSPHSLGQCLLRKEHGQTRESGRNSDYIFASSQGL